MNASQKINPYFGGCPPGQISYLSIEKKCKDDARFIRAPGDLETSAEILRYIKILIHFIYLLSCLGRKTAQIVCDPSWGALAKMG
jgi:hypothetical protein